MSQRVVIEVEGRFVDNITGRGKSATRTIEDIGKTADSTQKKLNNLSDKKANVLIKATDEASEKIEKVLNAGKNLAGKVWTALINLKDSGALKLLQQVGQAGRSIAGKVWTAAIRVKDFALSPLNKIKSTLFSIKSLIAAVTAGVAANKFVINPTTMYAGYEDLVAQFKILLGSQQAAETRLASLVDFAGQTPFTRDEIFQASRVLETYTNGALSTPDSAGGLRMIGDIAAATGTEYSRVATYMGRLYNELGRGGKSLGEPLMYLREMGALSAEQEQKIQEIAQGSGTIEERWAGITAQFTRFDGMMLEMSNQMNNLLLGVKSFFKNNLWMKLGEGISSELKPFLIDFRKWRSENKAMIAEWAAGIKNIAALLTGKVLGAVKEIGSKFSDVITSDAFKSASLGEKLSMLWKGVVADPLKEWWEGGAQQRMAQTAEKIGAWLGKTLSDGIKVVLGLTDILPGIFSGTGATSGVANIARSFGKAFADNFDLSGVTEKFKSALNNVIGVIPDIWNALPTEAKALVGVYAGTQAIGAGASLFKGLSTFATGMNNIAGFGKMIFGTPGNASVLGRGLTSKLATAGYKFTGGAAGSALSGGAAAAIGGATIAGAAVGGISGGHGIYDLYKAHKAYKAGDMTEFNARTMSGVSTLGGVGAGAAIGTLILPGVGTAIGAGIGGVLGWAFGSHEANQIRAANLESQEMKDALADSEASAEELNAAFEKAKAQNLANHFGKVALSMSEIQRIAEQVTLGDSAEQMSKFKSAVSSAASSFSSFQNATESVGKWMWKAGLGVTFSEDEQASIKSSFEEYISSAQSYIENEHYKFTAAVDLLLDVNDGAGKSIIESGNTYYAGIEQQLNDLGTQLSGKVDIALQDGVISLDEQAEITNLQQQIADIMNKVASAESDAKLQTMKVKFGDQDNISFESFQNLQSELQSVIDDQISSYDDALTASIASLNLQLADGAISQEQYDSQVQALIDGYETQVNDLKVKATNLQLEIAGEAYQDVLGDDFLSDMQHALQTCMDEGLEPIELSNEQLANLLKIDPSSLSEETAANLKEILQSIIDGSVPDQIEKTIGVDITAEPEIQNKIDLLVEDFGIEPEQAETITLLLMGDEEIMNQIDTSYLAEQFGIPQEKAEQILLKLSGAKTIENRLNILCEEFGIDKEQAENIMWLLTGQKTAANTITVTPGDFGVPDSISKTITVKISAVKQVVGDTLGKLFGGSGFRGGIFGGSGIPGYSDGGMVRGGSQLIKVAEEGSPEMVIPLSSQRRGRALKLWAQAGHMMDVPGFARGGVIGGNGSKDEGIRFTTTGDTDTSSQGVNVDVGGVTVSINVDSDGGTDIVQAIRNQSGEIAETVAGILANAFGAQFQNTPTRGGA